MYFPAEVKKLVSLTYKLPLPPSPKFISINLPAPKIRYTNTMKPILPSDIIG